MMMREDKDRQVFRDGIMRAVDRSMSHSLPCPGTARGRLSTSESVWARACRLAHVLRNRNLALASPRLGLRTAQSV